MNEFVLYGAPASLYTGKARAYLRKQGIEYRELSPGSSRYTQTILPAVGRFIIPVLETPEGEIVQDGTDIIDWFETRGLARRSAYPKGPRQRVVALLVDVPAVFAWNLFLHGVGTFDLTTSLAIAATLAFVLPAILGARTGQHPR